MFLPSWNDTENRQAILDFVAAAADEGEEGGEHAGAGDDRRAGAAGEPDPARLGELLPDRELRASFPRHPVLRGGACSSGTATSRTQVRTWVEAL